MNPRSVTTALEYGDGAKYIQFGTHSTYYQASKEGRVIDGQFKSLAELYPKFRDEELGRAISIPVEGDPSPELDEILKAVADHKGVYLDTGHISVPEALRLCELKDQYGIENLIISGSVTKIATMDELKKMVKMGAFIEQSMAGFSAAQMVPLTHYYVEKEYASIDEGMKAPETEGIRCCETNTGTRSRKYDYRHGLWTLFIVYTRGRSTSVYIIIVRYGDFRRRG
jgi:predicted 3-demethylubiquinone-9 3-methyltransferase (glyoxalase superfamily)